MKDLENLKWENEVLELRFEKVNKQYMFSFLNKITFIVLLFSVNPKEMNYIQDSSQQYLNSNRRLV